MFLSITGSGFVIKLMFVKYPLFEHFRMLSCLWRRVSATRWRGLISLSQASQITIAFVILIGRHIQDDCGEICSYYKRTSQPAPAPRIHYRAPLSLSLLRHGKNCFELSITKLAYLMYRRRICFTTVENLSHFCRSTECAMRNPLRQRHLNHYSLYE